MENKEETERQMEAFLKAELKESGIDKMLSASFKDELVFGYKPRTTIGELLEIYGDLLTEDEKERCQKYIMPKKIIPLKTNKIE